MRLLAAAVAATVVVALAAASPAAAKGGRTGELRLVGTRTTDDDIELRTYAARWWAPEMFVDSRRVPASCFPNRQTVVGVSTDRVASSVENLWRPGEATLSRPIVTVVGSREHAPVGVVVMPAPLGAERATARFLGNAEDTADVKHGWIVLAAHLPRGGVPDDGVVTTRAQVTVRDKAGKVILRTFAANRYGINGQPNRPECSTAGATPAPVPLPAPTGPPPIHEAGARESVTTVYEATYSAGGDADKALTYVEDGGAEEVRAAQQASAARSTQYRGRVTGKVTEVKFLNDHEAAVRFNLILDGGQPLVTGQIGRAVLVDGEWKVARSAYCELLAVGGGGVTC